MAIRPEGPDRPHALPTEGGDSSKPVSGRRATVSETTRRGSSSGRSRSPSPGSRRLTYAAPKTKEFAKLIGVSEENTSIKNLKGLDRLQLADLVKQHPSLKQSIQNAAQSGSQERLQRFADGWKFAKLLSPTLGKLGEKGVGELQKELVILSSKSTPEGFRLFLENLDIAAGSSSPLAAELSSELLEVADTLNLSTFKSCLEERIETFKQSFLDKLSPEDLILVEKHLSPNDLLSLSSDQVGDIINEIKAGTYGLHDELGVPKGKITAELSKEDIILLSSMQALPEYKESLLEAYSDPTGKTLKLLLKVERNGVFDVYSQLGLTLEEASKLSAEQKKILQHTIKSGYADLVKARGLDPAQITERVKQLKEPMKTLSTFIGSRFTDADALDVAIEIAIVPAESDENFKAINDNLEIIIEESKKLQALRPKQFFLGSDQETIPLFLAFQAMSQLSAEVESYTDKTLDKTLTMLDQVIYVGDCFPNTQVCHYAFETNFSFSPRERGDARSEGRHDCPYALKSQIHMELDLSQVDPDTEVDLDQFTTEINLFHPRKPEGHTIRSKLPYNGKMKASELQNKLKMIGTIINGKSRFQEVYADFIKENPNETQRLYDFCDQYVERYAQGVQNFNSTDTLAEGWVSLEAPETKTYLEKGTPQSALLAMSCGHLYSNEGTPSLLPPEGKLKPSFDHFSIQQLEQLRKGAYSGETIKMPLTVFQDEKAVEVEAEIIQNFTLSDHWEGGLLMQGVTIIKAAGLEVKRTCNYRLENQDETLDEAKARVTASPQFEIDRLLDYSKFLYLQRGDI
jgi:hypothetical protein